MMQDGTYFAKLVADEAVTSSAKSGNPQMELKVQVTHFHENGSWVAIQNVDRKLYLSLADGAWPYTQKKLEALGFQGDFANPTFAGEAVDTGVSLVLSHDDYQGKPKERWDLSDWGGGSGMGDAVDKDTARQLNARWKAESSQTSTRTAAPPPAVPAPDDEMPPPREPDVFASQPAGYGPPGK